MTIRQWKVFRAVVEQGSVTRAAQILYMSQPAVSHVVSEMEQQLGYTLLDRIGRHCRVNGRGMQPVSYTHLDVYKRQVRKQTEKLPGVDLCQRIHALFLLVIH